MDNYSKVLTFFMENGIQLTSDQIEALKEKFLDEATTNADPGNAKVSTHCDNKDEAMKISDAKSALQNRANEQMKKASEYLKPEDAEKVQNLINNPSAMLSALLKL